MRFEPLDYSGYLPLAPSTLSAEEAVAQMPLSDAARTELLRLFVTRHNQISDVPADRQEGPTA